MDLDVLLLITLDQVAEDRLHNVLVRVAKYDPDSAAAPYGFNLQILSNNRSGLDSISVSCFRKDLLRSYEIGYLGVYIKAAQDFQLGIDDAPCFRWPDLGILRRRIQRLPLAFEHIRDKQFGLGLVRGRSKNIQAGCSKHSCQGEYDYLPFVPKQHIIDIIQTYSGILSLPVLII